MLQTEKKKKRRAAGEEKEIFFLKCGGRLGFDEFVGEFCKNGEERFCKNGEERKKKKPST